MHRPAFSTAWAAFMSINVSVAMVGKKIGGRVQQNIDSNIFQNACPIRMSYVLNKSGFPIRQGKGYEVVSGADKSLYLFRVNEMMTYLETSFGKADKVMASPNQSNFAGMKGIVVVKGSGWSNARGHITLWDGSRCSDMCHMMHDPDNGPFVPDTAALWTLA